MKKRGIAMTLTNKMSTIAVAGLLGILGSCTREEIRPKETEIISVEGVKDGKKKIFTVEKLYIDKLTDAGVPRETALKYDARFHDNFNSYAYTFITEKIKRLYESNIDPEVINKYDRWLGVEEIVMLYQKNIMPEAANTYIMFERKTDRLIWLKEKEISPQIVKEYHERFRNIDATAIIELHEAGISPTKATEFHNTLNEDDVLMLTKAGVTTEQANAYAQLNRTYGADLTGNEIIYLLKQKIHPEAVEKRAKELLLDRIIRSK